MQTLDRLSLSKLLNYFSIYLIIYLFIYLKTQHIAT